MKYFFFLIAASAVFSCTKKSSSSTQAIEDSLTALETSPNDSTINALTAALDTFRIQKGNQDPEVATYYQKAIDLFESKSMPQVAMQLMKPYLSRIAPGADNHAMLQRAIAMQEKMGDSVLNQVLYTSYITRYPNDAETARYTSLIRQPGISTDSFLLRLRDATFNDSTYRLNEAMTLRYIEACELAAMADPSLTNAPEHLIIAAEASTSLRDIHRAIRIYDWIIDAYPTHVRAANALFLKGFVYDNELNDFDKAGKYYNEYLTRHPNDQYAESAKFLLKYLGKSEEEMIREVENMKKKVQ